MTAERAAVAGLALVAVVVWALVPTHPNYDAYYHLVWGRELLDGLAPSFEAYAAPTEHPLYLGLAAIVGLAGEDGDRLLVLVTALAHVVFTWGAYRLGRAAFGTPAGLLGALLAGSSFALLLYAARAYVDTPFLAVVVWAAVLEAERPRERPLQVLSLLAVAGTLRPEAWVLAGLYVLWRAPRRPLAYALAGTGPAVWALVDLAVTGDPAYSLHATSDLADELGRPRGLEAAVRSFFRFLGDTAREPVAAMGALGALLAWRHRARPAVQVLAGLFASGALTFAATGLAGLSILPRYLTVPAVVLCLLAGHAVAAAWAWRRAVVVVAAVLAAPVVGWFAVDRLERLDTELSFTRDVHDDLVAVLRTDAVARGRGCGPLTLPTYRLVPDARWILDVSRAEVGARSARRRDGGAALFLLGSKTLRRYGFADGTSPQANVPDPGFERVSRTGRFVVYVACPG